MVVLKTIVFLIVFLLSIQLGGFIEKDFKRRRFILLGMLLMTILTAAFFPSLPDSIRYFVILNGSSMVVAGYELSRIRMGKLKIKI